MKSPERANAPVAVVSPSVRRAWIEIEHHKRCVTDHSVTLREEGVD